MIAALTLNGRTVLWLLAGWLAPSLYFWRVTRLDTLPDRRGSLTGLTAFLWPVVLVGVGLYVVLAMVLGWRRQVRWFS